jgi:ABC-type nitrate/sulfonate/bicarbonate transport system substrate-binding protein
MKRKLAGAFSAFYVFLALLGSAEAQELKKVKIGYPAIAYNQIQVWIGKEAGLFKRYGLDAELVYFRGGQLATQALVAGDPPIVNIGTVVQAGIQGYDVVLIGSTENAYAYSVIARPSMGKVEQLKGKKLGVSSFGSASHNAALILLRRLNLEPNKDVAVLAAGGAVERLAAIQGGRIDATLLSPSEIPRARKEGLAEIFDMMDLGLEAQGNGLATTRSFIKSQRDIVKSTLKGWVEAISFIHSKQAESKKIVAKYMRTNDADVLDATVGWFVKRVPKKPYPTLKGIQFWLDEFSAQNPKAKTAKPEQFVDLSLLQELEKEGFFTELAKRYP